MVRQNNCKTINITVPEPVLNILQTEKNMSKALVDAYLKEKGLKVETKVEIIDA